MKWFFPLPLCEWWLFTDSQSGCGVDGCGDEFKLLTSILFFRTGPISAWSEFWLTITLSLHTHVRCYSMMHLSSKIYLWYFPARMQIISVIIVTQSRFCNQIGLYTNFAFRLGCRLNGYRFAWIAGTHIEAETNERRKKNIQIKYKQICVWETSFKSLNVSRNILDVIITL